MTATATSRNTDRTTLALLHPLTACLAPDYSALGDAAELNLNYAARRVGARPAPPPEPLRRAAVRLSERRTT